MKENISEELREFKSEIEEYIHNRYEFSKLHVAGELSKFFSTFMVRTIILYLMFFALLFFSLALAFLLGEWMESNGLAFVIVGGLYLLACGLFWILRKRIIEKPVIQHFLALLFPNFEDYEK